MIRPAMTTVKLTEEQVLYFRARRGHVAGPGAPNAAAAAGAIIGAQAQQLPPSLLALSLRTAGRPTAEALKYQLLKPSSRLVRTWGQRGTLHIYDAGAEWAAVVAARDLWAPGGRGGPMPTKATLDKALAVMKKAKAPITRTDLLGIAPRSYVRALQERASMAGMDADRLAAARLIWLLAWRGDACVTDKIGAEQAYATRSAWFPKLPWKPKPPREAAADLARKYLAVYGPATATDVAHFFGSRVTDARAWLAELDPQLVGVQCGNRKGLVALRDDIADLSAQPPTGAGAWPVRLLPLWESMLMAHADKSWTVPRAPDRKIVWRKAAYVAAVVLARGRVVATWSHEQKKRRLVVEVKPLSAWRKTGHAAGARREAGAIAAHLGLEGAEVTIR
jgi:hypothetical protein